MAYNVLAVTGTPCTGKTTLARKLGERLGWKVMELTLLVEREGLCDRFDEERNTKVVDAGRLKEKVWRLVESNTILDGLLSHLLDPTHVLVLRCDPRLLEKRMKERGYADGKIMENLEAEYEGVILYESLKRCGNVLELDNTEGVDVEAIVDWLQTGGKHILERDWTPEFTEVLESRGRAPT